VKQCKNDGGSNLD